MTQERPLDTATVASCLREYQSTLERYAWALLRDWSLAGDAVQNSFVALARFGGDVAPEARKSWLFKVVHREAIRIRNAESRQPKGDFVSEPTATYSLTPLAEVSHNEQIEHLRQRVASLPPEQQRILQMRIFEDKTFAQIAAELQIPLGTALSRMRLALERLRDENDE
jgi:RNA polymerase sigma-70 factor, ECF subfamily